MLTWKPKYHNLILKNRKVDLKTKIWPEITNISTKNCPNDQFIVISDLWLIQSISKWKLHENVLTSLIVASILGMND